MKARTVIVVVAHGSRGGHAPANPLRRSLPGADRVKPERNLGAAKPQRRKSEANPQPSPAPVTVKRQLVCKRSTIGRGGENSNGTPWSAKHTLDIDRSRSRHRSLPWLGFAA